jgi:hypothetical protein
MWLVAPSTDEYSFGVGLSRRMCGREDIFKNVLRMADCRGRIAAGKGKGRFSPIGGLQLRWVFFMKWMTVFTLRWKSDTQRLFSDWDCACLRRASGAQFLENPR